LIYLPPYSPDYNTIEQAFHSIKVLLPRHETKVIDANVQTCLIYQAAMSVSMDGAEGWALNCGY
ncbi:hypothetical protein BDR06DRAFT_844042, partial [Suillus hirtellus]